MDDIPFIGDKIKKKIKELIETGAMKKYTFLSKDEKIVTVDMLAEVWGVGPK
jgi:DNA polymerase lambda